VALRRANHRSKGSYSLSKRSRNWSETERFTDVLCSEGSNRSLKIVHCMISEVSQNINQQLLSYCNIYVTSDIYELISTCIVCFSFVNYYRIPHFLSLFPSLGSIYKRRKERYRNTVESVVRMTDFRWRLVSFSEVSAGTGDYSRQERNV
jgi:hypothetical protein